MSGLEGAIAGATRTDVGGLTVDEMQAGEARVKRVIYPPGWRWSTHMAPVTGTSSSDSGRAREAAVTRYDRALAQVARRADNLDASWRRFRGDCYRGRIAGNFDREWFSIFDQKTMQGAVAPGCGGDFNEWREEAFTIKNTVEALDEAARKEDIYPGTRRDLRHKYHLEWDR